MPSWVILPAMAFKFLQPVFHWIARVVFLKMEMLLCRALSEGTSIAFIALLGERPKS